MGWCTSHPQLIPDVDAVCWQPEVIMGLVLKDQSAHGSLSELAAQQDSWQLLDSRRAGGAQGG